MKFQKGMIMAALALVALAACKDKESDDPIATPKTKTETLTTGSWVTTDMLFDGTSLWAFLDACAKDNFMTFKTDGTVINDEGPTKCDPTDPQTESSPWKFTANETKIIIDEDTATIVTLTDTDFEVSMKDSASTIVLKMKKK